MLKHGVRFNKKHLQAVEGFCQNNNIEYEFWNISTVDGEDFAEFDFKTEESAKQVSDFAQRLEKLDRGQSFMSGRRR